MQHGARDAAQPGPPLGRRAPLGVRVGAHRGAYRARRALPHAATPPVASAAARGARGDRSSGGRGRRADRRARYDARAPDGTRAAVGGVRGSVARRVQRATRRRRRRVRAVGLRRARGPRGRHRGGAAHARRGRRRVPRHLPRRGKHLHRRGRDLPPRGRRARSLRAGARVVHRRGAPPRRVVPRVSRDALTVRARTRCAQTVPHGSRGSGCIRGISRGYVSCSSGCTEGVSRCRSPSRPSTAT